MKSLRVILSLCATMLLPCIASAQDASLEICNNGRADVDVAVAARIQSFITGYTWKTSGWYTVAAGTCATVYDEDYDAAGPYTPQSGARVAFTTLRPDGLWGAYHDDRVQASGWMRSGTGQICVNHGDAFTFREPAGDPAANCGGILIPVAHDFMPDGPGKFTFTMDWEGYGNFVAVGKGGQAKSAVARSSSSDSVDNSLSAQFLRALAQAAKEENDRRVANVDTAASNAKGRAAELEWVREDLTEYIEASRTGFEAYKTGEAQLSSDGTRVWDSSVKPALANGCWIVQNPETKLSKFYCSMPVNADAERARYNELTDDVTASLPEGWSVDSDPPFTGLPSKGYRSTSGAHGEIWLVDSNGAYELHFELIAAPSATQAAKPADDDDPIGEGGFITPPTPNKPPK
jgi:hypothetical protein